MSQLLRKKMIRVSDMTPLGVMIPLGHSLSIIYLEKNVCFDFFLIFGPIRLLESSWTILELFYKKNFENPPKC